MPNKENYQSVSAALTTIGAIGGIGYAMSKGKPFWTTAVLCVVFAMVGYGTGKFIESSNN